MVKDELKLVRVQRDSLLARHHVVLRLVLVVLSDVNEHSSLPFANRQPLLLVVAELKW